MNRSSRLGWRARATMPSRWRCRRALAAVACASCLPGAGVLAAALALCNKTEGAAPTRSGVQAPGACGTRPHACPALH